MPEARTLLLFRPEEQTLCFAAALEAMTPGRFRVVAAPLFGIEPVPACIDLAGVQGLAFTSAHAVAALAGRQLPPALPAWCVGASTAAAARRAGLAAEASGGDVAALARLVASRARPDGGAVLHLSGRHAAGDLVAWLAAAGIPARAVVVYDQAERPLPEAATRLLAAGHAEVLAFFSPRGVRLFAARARSAGWPFGDTMSVSISAAADAGLAGLGLRRRVVAPTPDRAGMLAVLAQL